jgi:peptidyl-dipeptidase Dcp
VAASRFNQGFATVEFLASGIVDMAWHSLDAKAAAEVDVAAFEAATLARIGMPAEIVMRHRSTHFSHIFAGGYAAGYYAYLWAEVLDADAFEAFRERGDIFHQPTATALRRHVFESGGTRDHAEAYRAFRGRDPDPQALMRNRGFA